MDSLPADAGSGPAAVLAGFRVDFHACLTARADELTELADAVLCADGPVRGLAGLSLAPGHRRGHGALYDAVGHGRIDVARLRRSLAGLPLPRAGDGRLMLAVDVSSTPSCTPLGSGPRQAEPTVLHTVTIHVRPSPVTCGKPTGAVCRAGSIPRVSHTRMIGAWRRPLGGAVEGEVWSCPILSRGNPSRSG